MIDCKTYFEERKNYLKQYVNRLNLHDKTLAVIQVGNDLASNSYIKGKKNDCEQVGIKCEHFKLDSNVSYDEIVPLIQNLNNNRNISGIIIQLPLPKHLNKNSLSKYISDEKDVDGFKKTSKFKFCTPQGIINLFKHLNVDLVGKTCVVIGKSDIVGKPMVNYLISKSATVISCNSKTKDLKNWTKQADIIISATGVKNLITKDMVNPNQIIIDVGINRDDGGKLCGDCSKDLYDYVDLITPVPKGVGLLTRLTLLEHVVLRSNTNAI